MATIGHTAVESQTDQWPPSTGYEVCFGPYTMSENGTLTGISMYWAGVAGADYTLYFAVWNDSSGAPGSRLCYSNLITVPQNAGMAQYDSSSINGTTTLTNGSSYWIGFNSNNNPGSGPALKCKLTGAASICRYLGSQTLGVPTDPFPGSPTTFAEEATTWITYTPASSGSSVLPTVILAPLKA